MYYKSTKFSKLDKLTFKVLDGNHTEKDVRQLSSLLKEDKNARKRYTSLTRQEALLHWEASAADSDLSNGITRSKIISFPVVSSIAAAIVAMFGVWIIHQYQDKSTLGLETAFYLDEYYTENSLSVHQPFSASGSFGEQSRTMKQLKYDFARKAPVGSTQRAFNDAIYGLEVLQTNRNFGEGGVVEYSSDIAS